MLTALICLTIGAAAGYWAGESVHPRALRIRRFVSRWWQP